MLSEGLCKALFPVSTTPLATASEKLLQYGSFELDYGSGRLSGSNGLYLLLGYENDAAVPFTLPLLTGHLGAVGSRAWAAPEAWKKEGTEAVVERLEACKITTATGKEKWVELWLRRSYDAAGNPLNDLGIIRDISDRRQQESENQQHLEELRRSNRELEDFAYVASHDLQEPLRKITTFCGRLFARYHDQLDREGSLYLDRILASAESMKALISNLLDYSRISLVEEALQPTRLDVLLLGVTADLELIIEETGTHIEVGPLPEIMGHAPLLSQLFTNLFTNAIKFRKPELPPRIRVRAHIPEAPELLAAGLPATGAFHCITVSDNGIGFEPQYAERIFQVFQRLHGKSEFPGTGIGLAICRKIAERHGGTLTASGTPNAGASFCIYFPAE